MAKASGRAIGLAGHQREQPIKLRDAVKDAKEVCEARHLRGSVGCYLCVAGRMLTCKPLRRERDIAITNRIAKVCDWGIPLAIIFLILTGLFISWQSQEILRLHAQGHTKHLLDMTLAELSNVNVTRM